ncbi:hypothetical protein AGLY_004259 [Aphis glycines]|uniref:Uncharacterized protein n=1 Tax=Aphis glycines TaxID=307491 RepID=A0A6G0TY28_APHGL|nr:hypothetical protein AGLY_004259 [Aphis glycines]
MSIPLLVTYIATNYEYRGTDKNNKEIQPFMSKKFDSFKVPHKFKSFTIIRRFNCLYNYQFSSIITATISEALNSLTFSKQSPNTDILFISSNSFIFLSSVVAIYTPFSFGSIEKGLPFENRSIYLHKMLFKYLKIPKIRLKNIASLKKKKRSERTRLDKNVKRRQPTVQLS